MVRDTSYCCGLAFLVKSFGGIMSCLFRSFRLSRQSPSPPSNTNNNNKKDRASRSKNSLADLFGSRRDDGGSPSKELEDGGVGPISQDDIDCELRDELMALKEVDYNNHKQVDSSIESPGRTADACSGNLNLSNRGKENSSVKEGLDASLSHWLKHSSKTDGVQNCQSASSAGSNSCKTSDMDRPILGTVAAHWNADESSRISPKWWDGNGIPNSTNKYKEDQKVSWHAIPFEKRLEEALSNESLVSQRKLSPEPVEYVGKGKSDMTGLKTS